MHLHATHERLAIAFELLACVAAFSGCSGQRAISTALPERSKPLVIAHRGASGHAPEHTFAAYDRALAMGADYIEQDLQFTADSTLVVMHDESLRRTARGPAAHCAGLVRDHTLRQLRDCEVGSWFNEATPANASPAYVGAQIPTLREVLARYGTGTRYYIETKSPESAPGMEEALVDELRRAGLLPTDRGDRRVLLQSFSTASLRKLHAMQPALPLIQLLSAWPERTPGLRDSAFAEIATYAIGVGPTRGVVDADFVRGAKRHGLTIHPYTVDDTLEMKRLLDLGADGIFTNYPDRLAALVRGR
jgi:glycerophosphoryl diester phosphodiesterase